MAVTSPTKTPRRTKKPIETVMVHTQTERPASMSEFPQPTSYTPLLMLLLLIASFVMGMMFNKLQSLEKTSSSVQVSTTPQPKRTTQTDIPVWAKAIGLDMNKFNQCYDKNPYQANIDKDITDGQAAGVSGTPSFVINGILLVGAQPYAVFKDAIEQALAGTQTGEKISVENGHLPSLGRSDAPVTMIEFSDFECPFCRSFFQETYPQLKKDYIDSGKVVLYYRQFPLAIHPLAQPFARATECAQEQGKFWQMHDKIFTAQET